jgi:hypothetical protein
LVGNIKECLQSQHVSFGPTNLKFSVSAAKSGAVSRQSSVPHFIFATKSNYAFSQTALEKVALLGSWFRAQSEKISSES